MSELGLTNINLRNGIWEGRLTGVSTTGARPDLRVTLNDSPVEGVILEPIETPGIWSVKIPVAPESIADGVQVFLIFDGATDTKLGEFAIIAGESASGDLRAEVALLRAELDMLKRAFRRHCVETM